MSADAPPTGGAPPVTVDRLQRWLDTPPFHRLLGLRAETVDIGGRSVVLRLPFRETFRRATDRAELHGGVTAALIDIAGDFAVATVVGAPVPTINLRIDYLRMAGDGELVATARVVKAGRTVAVVDIEVADTNGRQIAIGRGTYSTRAG